MVRGNQRIAVVNIPWYREWAEGFGVSADSIPGPKPSEWMVVSSSQIGRVAALALLAAFSWVPCAAQTEESSSPSDSGLGSPVTVHGFVKNAATGEPLPRALVQVNGESGTAVLTDGDGRFEIPGVPLGPVVFALVKPGFEDALNAPAGVNLRDLRGYTHSVLVTADTPELDFAMRPTNAILGQIELATGDLAQNIEVTLFARQIQNGRAVWRPKDATRSNAEGEFRFAHLSDGDYAVEAGPASDSEQMAGRLAPSNSAGDATLSWYARVFYQDAREFNGAAKLHLTGGAEAQAKLTLAPEALHPVQAQVLFPAALAKETEGVRAQCDILDGDGRHAPYFCWYDAENKTAHALLPDGSYTLQYELGGVLLPPARSIAMAGQIDLTVAGHAVTNLRIPVVPAQAGLMQVAVSRSETQTASQPGGGRNEVFVEVSQVGQLTDGMSSMLAEGPPSGTLDVMPPSPGRYWVHTVVGDPKLCEDSFTAGGANLGREPLVVGRGGSTAPLTLTLRDDCASLELTLPASAAGMSPGDEPEYTVYIVPDFDSTTGAQTRTFRASTMAEFVFNGLTPGSYHVYTFAAPVELEYQDRDALGALHGQGVTIEPGGTGKLELEVPAQ